MLAPTLVWAAGAKNISLARLGLLAAKLAGLGWLLIITAPLVTTFFIDVARTTFIDDIEKQQEKLEEEWGPEVKRRKASDDL